ncbi:Uncharacterised protein [Acinetobacter baumannii]|nr:Uncharacterised protein [Acinetobacter baumannii]SVK54818.1 Uncharacterised protein [Acinetobacter baumannii]
MMLGINRGTHFNHIIKPVTHTINFLIIFMSFAGNHYNVTSLSLLCNKFNCFTAVMNFMHTMP